MDPNLDQLEVGKKYTIISKVIPGVWNKPRTMTFTYFDKNEQSLFFHGHPLCGTQEIARRHIERVILEPDDAEHKRPKIFRG